MLARTVQPALAFVMKDFFEGIRSRRVLVVFIFVGSLLVVASIATAIATPTRSLSKVSPAEPVEVWIIDANGILVGIAFGLTPFLLPFAPILATRRLLEADRDRGILQLALTKPVPPWGVALGKFAGLYGALASYTALLSVIVVVAIQAFSGASVNGNFALLFVAGNVLLVGLYL